MSLPSIFAALGALYCATIAVFPLLEKRRNVTALLFAAYSLSNGLWNVTDIIVLSRNPRQWEWMLRFTGIGGCLLVPFVLDFIRRASGLESNHRFRNAVWTYYFLGLAFTILHQTPLVHTTVIPNAPPGISLWTNGGPLYPAFVIYMLSGMALMGGMCVYSRLKSTGLQLIQTNYLLAATAVGSVALGSFFLSTSKRNLFWIYYPCQASVSFIFGYSIYQHNLLPIRVAFKRALLVVGLCLVAFLGVSGIAAGIGGTAVFAGIDRTAWPALIVAIAASATVPITYSWIVRKSRVFQDSSSAHLAHEFKSPLYAIESAKSILEDELGKSAPNMALVSEYFALIDRNTARLNSLVGAIMSVAAADAQPALSVENVDLVHLFNGITMTFANASQRISVSGPRSAVVRGNKEGLEQIFRNILSNSIKYAPAGPIEVLIRTATTMVEVSIRDYGIGIPKERIAQIFKPFVRAHANGSQKGHGLGLTIAKKWVEAHGGQIWAESEGEGKGGDPFIRFACYSFATTKRRE